jgi:bifunctional non-homologous end joining protein LigD
MPLHWREVEKGAKGKKGAEALRFEIPQAIKRVEKEGDLFEPVLKLRQRLPDLPTAD